MVAACQVFKLRYRFLVSAIVKTSQTSLNQTRDILQTTEMFGEIWLSVISCRMFFRAAVGRNMLAVPLSEPPVQY